MGMYVYLQSTSSLSTPFFGFCGCIIPVEEAEMVEDAASIEDADMAEDAAIEDAEMVEDAAIEDAEMVEDASLEDAEMVEDGCPEREVPAPEAGGEACLDGCPLGDEDAEALLECPFESQHPDIVYYNSEQLRKTYKKLDRLEALNERMRSMRAMIEEKKLLVYKS